jgi:SAM-dependent methyltransferase
MDKIYMDGYMRNMSNWLNGISSEAAYWEGYIAKNVLRNKENWLKTISDERAFDFDKYINSNESSFLDVGSGPFSNTGNKTNKAILEYHAADPLAFIYEALKKRYGITTGIKPEFAYVEKLKEKYGENKFDIVHMSNALDHSFDPIYGIYQMLSVCKIGGIVILEHYENEAEFENYEGFHQWNLCIKNHDFYIWKNTTGGGGGD